MRPIFLTRTQRLKPLVVRCVCNLIVLGLFAFIGVLLAWRV
jgi:hypothetical protein